MRELKSNARNRTAKASSTPDATCDLTPRATNRHPRHILQYFLKLLIEVQDFQRFTPKMAKVELSGALGRMRDMVIFIIVGGISALFYLLLNVVLVREFSMRPALAI